MNNIAIINTFNSDDSKTSKIKTQHSQIMTIITNAILKFKLVIEIPVVTSYTFFTVYYF